MKLSDYENLVKGKTCRWHESPLPLPAKVDHYDHDGGWAVEGFEMKQWLSVTCPSCDYGWSLWKLGIQPRNPQSGQGVVEYSLMVLLVALVFWVAVKNTTVGEQLTESWNSVKACVETPVECGK